VHLKGTFNCTRHAAAYWRKESKEGRDRGGSVINVVSRAGLIGNPGQCNYGSAKAGIAAFTVISALELERYGVRVNAVCPIARTRMTTDVKGGVLSGMMAEKTPEGEFDVYDPANTAPVIAYLASEEAKDITGKVFRIEGGTLELMEGWHTAKTMSKGDARWAPKELVMRMKELL